VVKQIVTQDQKQKTKQRTATVRKAGKTSITTARKRYTAAKKVATQKIRAAHKSLYNAENAKIKALPSKRRQAVRKGLRARLKTKLDKLLKLMKPGSFYKKVEDVERGITQLRKIKW
jgi:hypothetical protein